MRQFEIGDMIKYPVFYKGFNVKQEGMIASERKGKVLGDCSVDYGYEVLNESNNNIWVWEYEIEEVGS